MKKKIYHEDSLYFLNEFCKGLPEKIAGSRFNLDYMFSFFNAIGSSQVQDLKQRVLNDGRFEDDYPFRPRFYSFRKEMYDRVFRDDYEWQVFSDLMRAFYMHGMVFCHFLFFYVFNGKKALEEVSEAIFETFKGPCVLMNFDGCPCIQILENVSINRVHQWMKDNSKDFYSAIDQRGLMAPLKKMAPIKDLNLFLDHYFHDMSYKEIVEKHGGDESQLRNRISRIGGHLNS